MEGIMSEEARAAKRRYQQEYRRKHRDQLNARRRAWGKSHPELIRRYNAKYWEKVAQKGKSLRASYEDYGITPKRLKELQEIARSDEYASLVFSAARAADEKAAGHLLLSVTRGIPYEHLEFHEKLGRCLLGRTNFYGARRLLFHYLDEALRSAQEEKRNE